MNKLLPIFVVAAVCLFKPVSSDAQMPIWAFNIGGTANDVGWVCKAAPNGNVYLAGSFQGTMDLDPGPGVYNVTSAGLDDIFLACYSPAGTFLWGFRIGDVSYDAVNFITVDSSSNVYISGYFRGFPAVDFDPGPGIALLTDAGNCCGSPPWDGDGYIAKYSPTGSYLWAHDLGAETVYDHSCGISVDDLQNVYIVGEFTGTMVASPTVTLNSAATGKCYIIKYNSAGNVIWVDNFGLPGYAADDTFPWDIRVTLHGVYICGVVQGTSYFNPAGGSFLTAAGYYDGFIAKYDTAGHYIFAKAITGAGTDDEGYNMVLDSADNIYVTGFTNSSALTFDGSMPSTTTVTCPGGGGNYDIFAVKYDSNGVYKWGHVTGGSGNDIGRSIEIMGNSVIITGQFSGTVDFDPSPAVANLVSNGGYDIYIAKYDLNGNYICGFNIGSTTDDMGWRTSPDRFGNLYASGQFSGTGVDFDPGTGSTLLSSVGGSDAYLVKYTWSDTSVTGHIEGDTICSGDIAHLILVITSGTTGPFNITISDGTASYTLTGIMSGVPFILPVTPGSTTTYSITAISFAGMSLCNAVSGASFGTATVIVNPSPTASISTTQLSCNQFQFSTPAGYPIVAWTLGDGSTSASNPVTHTYGTAGTYKVTVSVTSSGGCTAKDSTNITVTVPPVVDLGPDTSMCATSPSYTISPLLTYPATATYLWSTGSTASSITVNTSGTYRLTVSDNGCSGSDSVRVTFKPQPEVFIGNDTVVCPGVTLKLKAHEPAGTQYLWSTGATDSTITVTDPGTYTLNVDLNGCTASASITVTQGTSGNVNLGPDTTLCIGDKITLTANTDDAIWSNNHHGPSITVDFPGIYWVTVPEECGDVTDSIRVDFHLCDIGFPTAFTPNGDGKNDVIGVVGTLKYYSDYSLSIYNRWGQRVFYTQDIYAGWDGIFNGTPQDLGTYFYLIYYSLEGRKHMMKGDFELVR